VRIAYVLSRYPVLTETFIREELLTMLGDGVDLRVYPLRGPQDTAWVIADQPDGGISERVRRFGFALSPANLAALVREALRAPGRFAAAARLLLRVSPGGAAGAAKALFLLPKLCRIAGDLRGFGPCHVHAHFANLPAAGAAFLGRLLPAPCSFTSHAFDIYGRDRASLDRLATAVDFVVTISERNRAHHRAGLPASRQDRVHLVHCGVDTDDFAPAPATPDGPFLAVGRLVPKKGFHLLVRALATLRDQGLDRRCVIIGEGEQRGELAALIAELGLGDRVTLAGPLPPAAVREALTGAAAFVLPCIETPGGDVDGIPVSLMEAMAMRKVVVTTAISGIGELVTDGVDGLLLPPGDVAALASALARLAGGEVDTAALGERARARVEAGFDRRRNARRLQALVAAAAEGSPR
jgi:colanic acid/amylovoran biosynthesis glycosyltransferase